MIFNADNLKLCEMLGSIQFYVKKNVTSIIKNIFIIDVYKFYDTLYAYLIVQYTLIKCM